MQVNEELDLASVVVVANNFEQVREGKTRESKVRCKGMVLMTDLGVNPS